LRAIYLSFSSPVNIISYFTGARNDREDSVGRIGTIIATRAVQEIVRIFLQKVERIELNSLLTLEDKGIILIV